MKARWPGSRNVAVAGKDRAAVMMSGPCRRPALVLERQDLRHRSGRRAGAARSCPSSMRRSPPRWRSRGRRSSRRHSARPRPSRFRSRAAASRWARGSFARAAGDLTRFRASPELDGDTLALAAGLVDEMQLGRGTDPDLLAISLSATDYVGHTYGTEGEEMCLQLLELDREIGDFLQLLDSRGIDYAVVLTADHGGKDIPERERLAGVAGRGPRRSRAQPGDDGQGAGRASSGCSGPGLLGDARWATSMSTSISRRPTGTPARRSGRGLPRASAGRGRVHRARRSPRRRSRPAPPETGP